MWARNDRLHRADVIAVFENQDDADEAVLQLRLSGFRDSRIGYFAQHPNGRLTDLLGHDRAFSGSIVGAIAGALVGVGAAWLLNEWFTERTGTSDFLGLAITLATFMALFVGFVGWSIGGDISRRAVDPPAVDPATGPFVLAVVTGSESEKVRAMMREYGGSELQPNMAVAHPTAV